jgi:hypothetical protein
VRVPTSCLKNGKCKECVVEIAEGMECLSPATPYENHLAGNFRLSCQALISAGEGHLRCHTMRRGHMRIERHALGLPTSGRPMELDPAVTRQGDRILIDGAEVERSTGPIYGIAMDLGPPPWCSASSTWKPARWWPTPRSRIRSASAGPTSWPAFSTTRCIPASCCGARSRAT